MLSKRESGMGYGGAAAGAKHEEKGTNMMSYTGMRRMSMEERSREEMVGGSWDECAAAVVMGSSEEDGSRRVAQASIDNCREMKGAAACSSGCRREEEAEGFADNDDGFTRLTLGTRTLHLPCLHNTAPDNAATSISHSSRSNSGVVTRTCKLCGTSKTPLWRGGPMGAKSLCNACGIRSKKAKKLSAAAANEGDEGQGQKQGGGNGKCKSLWKQGAKKRKIMKEGEGEMELERERQKKKKKRKQKSALLLQKQQLVKPSHLHVDEGMRISSTPSTSSPVKTESSSCVTSRGTPSPCSTHTKPLFPSSISFLSPHPSFHHIHDPLFSKDVEQAAFLLMALSCGLVLS